MGITRSFGKLTLVSLSAALAACAVEPSVESGPDGGMDLLPGQATATYSVQIDDGASQASCAATYHHGDATLSFSDGETVTANGAPLAEESLFGVGYYGSVPVVAAGQAYAFVLTVPGEGAFTTNVVMPGAATLTSPAAGAQVSSASPLTVMWSNAAAGMTDQVEVDLGGASNTFTATAGATTLTVSAADLMPLYKQAAGTASGTVSGTLTLHRGQQITLGAPFAGGSSSSDVSLDQVSISVTP